MLNPTERQKKAADYFLELGNKRQAAIKAGYNKNYAYKLFDNKGLQTYVGKRLAQLESERIASVEEIMENLTSILRGAAPETEALPCVRERMKAAELLGKRYGMFTDKANFEDRAPVFIYGEDVLED